MLPCSATYVRRIRETHPQVVLAATKHPSVQGPPEQVDIYLYNRLTTGTSPLQLLHSPIMYTNTRPIAQQRLIHETLSSSLASFHFWGYWNRKDFSRVQPAHQLFPSVLATLPPLEFKSRKKPRPPSLEFSLIHPLLCTRPSPTILS